MRSTKEVAEKIARNGDGMMAFPAEAFPAASANDEFHCFPPIGSILHLPCCKLLLSTRRAAAAGRGKTGEHGAALE